MRADALFNREVIGKLFSHHFHKALVKHFLRALHTMRGVDMAPDF